MSDTDAVTGPAADPATGPAAAPATDPAADPGHVTYVYAIGRAGTPLDEAARRLVGQAGSPLRTVGADGLAALVSSLPADAYGADGMRARMEDLAELEALARTHHATVEAAYASTTVLPMRLATVYLDDTRVAEMLRERSGDLGALLSSLEGQVELGVKVYADPSAATARSPEPDVAAADPAAGPGRAYLQRRRTQRRDRRDIYRAAGAVAAQVPERLAGLVRGRVAHRPQQGELASGAGENIANDAYLVPAERVRAFRRALAGLSDAAPGVRVEITGPWVPYSFATPPHSGGTT
ncbi:GvpL/GvpF family gas vesicle protein [Streptomyces hebeiensis]